MMRHPNIYIIVYGLILVGLLAAFGTAEVIGPILQYKLDRLYFPYGEEADLYPGHLFLIYKGDSLIYRGLIEHSMIGVSYSYPTGGIFDTVEIGLCRAVIETAEIDTGATITIGISEFPKLYGGDKFPMLFPPDSSAADSTISATNSGNRLVIKKYGNYTEMLIAFETGEIEAFVSYRNYDAPGKRYKAISAPAPYIAVLAPDISRAANDKGLLTTSLYYRYNPKNPEILFDGDGLEPCNCLYPSDSGCDRFYEYDPEKGEVLLTVLDKRPRKLKIAAADPKLLKTAEYFADVLSRDRIKTEIAFGRDDYDMIVMFIPMLSGKSESGMQSALGLIGAGGISDKTSKENIKVIGNYIELGRLANSQSGREYYFHLADRGFKEDFGLFPLYRPSLYFVGQDYLKGGRFDEDGSIDLRPLYLIKPMANQKERQP
nr:hypothetical protein [candidate division Zixibacteria bacterium]